MLLAETEHDDSDGRWPRERRTPSLDVTFCNVSLKRNSTMLLSYKSIGNGTNLVIALHDWLGDAANYLPLAPHLDLERFTYVLADIRGYGGSKNLEGTFSLGEIAGDVLDLAKHLGAEQFHLLGHSMTGLVVQRLAIDHPGKITSGAMISPVFASGFSADPQTLDSLLRVATLVEPTIDAISARTGGRYSREWCAQRARRAHSTSRKSARTAYLRMFTTASFAEEAKAVRTPLMVLSGTRDIPFYRPGELEVKFASCYPNVEFGRCESAGHYSMLETPVFVACKLNEFYTRFAVRP